jgi:autotransporter-associated beta strand protein
MRTDLPVLCLRIALMAGSLAIGAIAAAPDPLGILHKPIPERLVVLTFDDGCVSHATHVAPLLEEYRFGATFYVCKPGTFTGRRDWYMTDRDLRALAEAGFEIGNHTSHHQGGAGIGPFLDLEDYLLAHKIAKPSTVCWPVYRVNMDTIPALLENGYGFGRGGHHRTYRPTADHPFDVPSFTLRPDWTMEKFVSVVRQATEGRVVVLTYHGVPDIQHPWVNVDPGLFREMMRYLKTNQYKVIAMRGLADYIDVAKATKLPPTAKNFKESDSIKLVMGDAPYVAVGQLPEKKMPANGAPRKKEWKKVRLHQEELTPAGYTVDDDTQVTLMRLEATGPLVLNGGSLSSVNGFGDTWSGPVTLHGNTEIHVYAALRLGPVSGPGGLTMAGRRGGRLVLNGPNNYRGPTRVKEGRLELRAPLSGTAPGSMTPANITIESGAELLLHVGGAEGYTAEQAGRFLEKITGETDHSGLMAGAVFAVDTSLATGMVTIDTAISDPRGPGGGPFVLRKSGAGTMQLSGNNTFTGPVEIRQGTLRVASINSVADRKPTSNLGAPTDPLDGRILLGDPKRAGHSGILYTGTGERTDRGIHLIGGTSSITLAQAGTGLLQITGPLVLAGYGSDKTIILSGSTAGRGELAAAIEDPYDRARKARTAITKTGTGSWTLSGANTYTGTTTVSAGTLVLAGPGSLGPGTDVHLSEGAMLDLPFGGEVRVDRLVLDGIPQPAGRYDATARPSSISGPGTLIVR